MAWLTIPLPQPTSLNPKPKHTRRLLKLGKTGIQTRNHHNTGFCGWLPRGGPNITFAAVAFNVE